MSKEMGGEMVLMCVKINNRGIGRWNGGQKGFR